MPIGAGRMRERVRIEESIATPDGGGGRTRRWSLVAAVWAEVKPINGGEPFRAGVLRSTQFYRVTIRYRTDVTPAHRLVWRGTVLDIRTCGDVDGERAALVMTVESGVPNA